MKIVNRCIILHVKTKYEIGMVVYGKITGVKPYGAFVGFEDGWSGLIHISELSNGFVRDVANIVTVGEYCMLKVIDIDYEHQQLRLSYKALNQNVRKYSRRVRFEGIPKAVLGFSSIANMMPIWLKEKK